MLGNGLQAELQQRQIELSHARDRLSRAESEREANRELARKHAADAWEAEKAFLGAIATLAEQAALAEQQAAQLAAKAEADWGFATKLRELAVAIAGREHPEAPEHEGLETAQPDLAEAPE